MYLLMIGESIRVETLTVTILKSKLNLDVILSKMYSVEFIKNILFNLPQIILRLLTKQYF